MFCIEACIDIVPDHSTRSHLSLLKRVATILGLNLKEKESNLGQIFRLVYPEGSSQEAVHATETFLANQMQLSGY